MTAVFRWLVAAFIALAVASAHAQEPTPPASSRTPDMAPNPPSGMSAASPEPSAAPKTVWSEVRVNGPYIAMTFDDGPSKALTPKLLDILKERHMHVTFFVVGENAKDHPEILQRALDEGHEIGNHSWSHPNFAKMSDEAVKSELNRTKDAIMAGTGGKPVTLMRPPYGSFTKEQRRWFHDDLGYTVVLWDVDPLDWKRPGPTVVEQRILEGTHNGSIILSHDIHPGTVEAMPDTFDKLLAKGFKFVTVSELIAMNQPEPPKPAGASNTAGRMMHMPHTTPRPIGDSESQPARQNQRVLRPVSDSPTQASPMGTPYNSPIANDYLELRAELGTALFALVTLANDSHAAPELVQTLQSLQGGLKEPFLFVVAGEVKAGKSSLLNALFGEDFCRVDVLPATDRVNVFKYGDQAHDVPISPSLIERYQPIEFLHDFNIVDTPGTNTIVADHQTITERFVPQADLIVFVFSVVNPWGASAWQFLELLQKRWLKNVIFVLQQMDLRDETEVQAVIQHLRQTAMTRLGQSFPIFPVSAKKAFLAKTSGEDKDRLWKESNFAPLEDYINETVGTGEARRSKLKSVCQTAQVVLNDLAKQARSSQDIIAADKAQLTRLHATVAQLRRHSDLQVEGFLRGVDTAYARCQQQGEHLLTERLKFPGSLKLVFGRDTEWQVEFQRNIEGMLRTAISKQIEHSLNLLEGELKNVWSQLHDTLQANFGPESRQQFGTGIPEFNEQRSRLFERVEVALVENMSDDQIEKQLQGLFAETATWVRLPIGAVAAGGVATIVAAHIAMVAVADITGTLTALTAIVGTLIAVGKRRKVIDTYRAQMSAKQVELTQSIGDLIRQTIDVFYQKLAQVYQPLEMFCNVQAERYQPVLEKVESLEKDFEKIAGHL